MRKTYDKRRIEMRLEKMKRGGEREKVDERKTKRQRKRDRER